MFVDDEYYDSSARVALNTTENDLPIAEDHPFSHQIKRGDLGGMWEPLWQLTGLPDRPTELARYIALYDATIRGADRCIGKLIEAVDQMPFEQRPIIAFIGDHGESLGEHNYFFEHGRLPYEDVLHVPMIIRFPASAKAPARIAKPVAVIDLAPTLLELAGLPVPRNMEGRSLVSAVTKNAPRGDIFFAAGYQFDFMTGIRRDQWKLVHVPNEIDRSIMSGAEYELYDLSNDPGELNNLAQDRPEMAAALRAELEKWTRPWWKRASTMQEQGPAPEMDEEARRRLIELGYLKADD
jgi:arylsulfatase A-like enzyme